MDDPLPVRLGHGAGQGLDQPRRLAGRPRGAVEPVGQAPAADVLHLEVGEAVVLADVEDLDDVGVLELGDGLGLGQEAGGGLGRRRGAPARIIFRATGRLSRTWRAW